MRSARQLESDEQRQQAQRGQNRDGNASHGMATQRRAHAASVGDPELRGNCRRRCRYVLGPAVTHFPFTHAATDAGHEVTLGGSHVAQPLAESFVLFT